MSIPKEPRQIMINLMYLVLTAMLALNVSAEIINAFFKLQGGIDRTNSIVADANNRVVTSMEAAVKKKPDYKPLVPAAKEVQMITKDFTDYIDDVTTRFYKDAGGIFGPADAADQMPPVKATDDTTKWGKPVRYKDKEVPTRFFVEGFKPNSLMPEGQVAEGPKIKQKILDTRAQLEAAIKKVSGNRTLGISQEEVNEIIDKLTLEVDTTDMGGKSWSQFNFGYMPVAACLPILSKIKNDAKTSEASVVNFLASKIGATTVKFDKFVVSASPKKTFLLQGDKYEADIFLSAASSQAQVSINVGGQSLSAKDGVATYTTTASGLGEKSYTANITVKNPFNGKQETYKKTFNYQVGTQSGATVSADKMNVFYIGVDNPVSVAAGGDFSKINASCSGGGCNMSKTGGGKYNVRVSTPGKASVSVSAPDVKSESFEFRVKRIPDPVAMIGRGYKSSMGTGEFKAQEGIRAELKDFDFEARCKISGFEIARVPKRADPIVRSQAGGRYDGTTQNIVQAAKPGDIYYFSRIKAKCPGDAASRQINDLVINIK